jgi:hypothetical protein
MKLNLLVPFGLIALAGSNLSLLLTVPLIPPAAQGQSFNSLNDTASGGAVVSISGGTPPYTCSLASGSLPTGMTLSEVTPVSSPDGLCIVSGTPSVSGDFTFNVQVADSASHTSTQSVTLVVVSSTLPVISNVTTTALSTTSTQVSWTTNVPTDSRVAYGPDYYYYLTPEQDAAGVTSHTVTIAGLQGGQVYLGAIIARGISAGVPQDYLTAYQQNVSLPLQSAPSTGTFDFAIKGTGANNVVQGYPAYIGIYNWALAGVSTFASISFQVTGIPPNTQVHWPDEQDYNMGQCNVGTTTTTNDTLTCYGIGNNTQFEILTNVGGTTATGSYTLTITAKGTATGSAPTHSFTWPLNVVTTSFPSGTPTSYPAIPSLALWQSNMIATWPVGSSGQGNWFNGEVRTGGCESYADDEGIQYYDGAWVYDQIGMYTNNLAYWATGTLNSSPCAISGFGNPQGAKAPSALYREYLQAQSPPGNGMQGFWVFPHGLYYDCKSLSDTQACTYLHDLAINANGASMIANTIPYTDGVNVREAAYMLGAKRLDYDAGGGTTLAQVKAMVAYCLGIEDQIVNGTVGWEQPFMDGLLAQALIEYYLDPNTGNQQDVRIPPAIKALADHLWSTAWIPWVGTNGNFFYNSVQYQVGFATNPGNGTAQMLESLNLLIAPMYAWLYQQTGQQQYLLEGDTIWYAGVNDPPSDGIAWSGKNFSQQYRWSFDYVQWRSGSAAFVP